MNDNPSDFLKKGFPWSSIFQDAQCEATALVYLHALVAAGDSWNHLESNEVIRLVSELPGETMDIPDIKSLLQEHSRIEVVSKMLLNSYQASLFSPAWRIWPQ